MQTNNEFPLTEMKVTSFSRLLYNSCQWLLFHFNVLAMHLTKTVPRDSPITLLCTPFTSQLTSILHSSYPTPHSSYHTSLYLRHTSLFLILTAHASRHASLFSQHTALSATVSSRLTSLSPRVHPLLPLKRNNTEFRLIGTSISGHSIICSLACLVAPLIYLLTPQSLCAWSFTRLLTRSLALLLVDSQSHGAVQIFTSSFQYVVNRSAWSQ